MGEEGKSRENQEGDANCSLPLRPPLPRLSPFPFFCRPRSWARRRPGQAPRAAPWAGRAELFPRTLFEAQPPLICSVNSELREGGPTPWHRETLTWALRAYCISELSSLSATWHFLTEFPPWQPAVLDPAHSPSRS